MAGGIYWQFGRFFFFNPARDEAQQTTLFSVQSPALYAGYLLFVLFSC